MPFDSPIMQPTDRQQRILQEAARKTAMNRVQSAENEVNVSGSTGIKGKIKTFLNKVSNTVRSMFKKDTPAPSAAPAVIQKDTVQSKPVDTVKPDDSVQRTFDSLKSAVQARIDELKEVTGKSDDTFKTLGSRFIELGDAHPTVNEDMKTYLKQTKELLQTFRTLHKDGDALVTKTTSGKSGELAEVITAKWAELSKPDKSLLDRIDALKAFPKWLEATKALHENRERAVTAVTEGRDRITTALQRNKDLEIDFKQTFIRFKKQAGKVLAYTQEQMMVAPTRDVKKLAGPAFNQPVFNQTASTLKELYMEREFNTMYRHYHNLQYDGEWTGGTRPDSEIQHDITATVDSYLKSAKITDPAKQQQVRDIFEKRFGESIKGALSTTRSQSDLMAVISFSKDAYMSVPRFYLTTFNSLTQYTETTAPLKDTLTMEPAAIRKKADQFSTVATLSGTLAARGVDHLEGDIASKKVSTSSVDEAIDMSIKQHQHTSPDSGIRFDATFKTTLSGYVTQRLQEKRLVDDSGKAQTVKKRFGSGTISLETKDKGKASLYSTFQTNFGPKGKYHVQYKAIEEPLTGFVNSQHARKVQTGGLYGEMEQSKKAVYDKRSHQLSRLTGQFQLKMKMLSNVSIAKKLDTLNELKGAFEDNITGAQKTYGKQEIPDLQAKADEIQSKLTTSQSDLTSFKSQITAFASSGAIDLESVKTSLSAMSKAFESVKDTVETLGALADSIPYYHEVKAALMFGKNLLVLAKDQYKFNQLQVKMKEAQKTIEYFVSDELSKGDIADKVDAQTDAVSKFLTIKDERDADVLKAAASFLDCLAPVNLGSFLLKAKELMIDLPVKDMAAINRKVAKDSLLILSGYRALSTTTVEDSLSNVFSTALTSGKPLYDFAAAVHDGAGHLPTEQEITHSLDVFLSKGA